MSGIIQEKILDYLKNNGCRTLTEIRNHIDESIQKPIVLYHLKKLLDLGRIIRNDDKTYQYYSGQSVQLVKIPCYGEAKAGIDAKIKYNEEPDYFVAVPPSCLKGYNPKDLFIMQVSGDSMEPTLYDSSYVVFKKEFGNIPKDDDIVLYKTTINNNETYIAHRIIDIKDDYYVLRGDSNPNNDEPVYFEQIEGVYDKTYGFLSFINATSKSVNFYLAFSFVVIDIASYEIIKYLNIKLINDNLIESQ